MREKVLITGGAGYLGSVITRHLLDQGHEVTCLDNLMYGQTSHRNFLGQERYQFVQGDARDKDTVKELVGEADTIIPLAAIVGMPACNRLPEDAQSTNYDSIVMLNNLRGHNQKLIFPTTNSGYGTKTQEMFCTEETPLEPISLYGKTKSDAETHLLNSGKPVVTFRLATVFGVSPRMRLDLLVNDFVFKALTDGELKLFEAHFKRNYIPIKDVARVFQHAMGNFDSMQGRPYNAGLEEANLSKMELALKIQEHIPGLKIGEEPGRDPDQRNYVVSNKRLISTGFETKHTLDEGIEELIALYTNLLKTNTPKTLLKTMRNA